MSPPLARGSPAESPGPGALDRRSRSPPGGASGGEPILADVFRCGFCQDRRRLYTFWQRTVGPPSMVTFDAAGRDTCIVREVRTNTPLQALSLLNDVTFVEAARVLAERVLRAEPDGIPAVRVDRMMRLLLA